MFKTSEFGGPLLWAQSAFALVLDMSQNIMLAILLFHFDMKKVNQIGQSFSDVTVDN